jgi:hypothetical protein
MWKSKNTTSSSSSSSIGFGKVWNIKVSATVNQGYYELRQHKPWFDEECSKLLHQIKEAKLQWLQNPSQGNGNNLNNKRCETSGTFRNR